MDIEAAKSIVLRSKTICDLQIYLTICLFNYATINNWGASREAGVRYD